MFEQEIEMEKQQSSVLPLLLVVALVVATVGAGIYFLIQSRQVLTAQEATNLAVEVLKAQGPATVKFHTGAVRPSVNDKPSDPHYRLLEKAGVVKLEKAKGGTSTVALTPKGEALLKQISGVKESKEKDGTEAYVVPLAERTLVAVSNVTMTGTGRAKVQFTWKWETNALGESFDASGAALKAFNTWDRSTLIQKYGAAFYHEAPKAVMIAVEKTDKGWQLASE
jgi:predicted transcriptional regulator